MLSLSQRINSLSKLGRFLAQYQESKPDEDLQKLNQFFLKEYHTVIQDASLFNGWFTLDNLHFALEQWSQALSKENLEAWTIDYPADYFEHQRGMKTVAIIMAGNIPLVGLHDLICVLISGHRALVKPSSDDAKLIPFIMQMLVAIEKDWAAQLLLADGQLKDFDAVIATGSNNSARYFDHYFGKYPHIIRKNRNSVAVLSGDESKEELELLGEDVFRYFGLGCRNVSKVYLPADFDVQRLFEAFFKFKGIEENAKYGNNYDYNRAIYLMEHHDFLENGFCIIKESEQTSAPVSVLHYERYQSLETLEQELESKKEELQCVVSKHLNLEGSVNFGESQQPKLWDYADNVDTLKFLRSL